MAIDGYLVPNITSNVVDNSRNVAAPLGDASQHPTIASSPILQNSNALSWHIPRPSLISSSQENSIYGSIVGADQQITASTTAAKNAVGVHRGFRNHRNAGRGSTSTQGSTSSSSTNSTQSAKSGSLLLTVANLAKIDQEQLKTVPGKSRDQQHAINLQYYLEQQNQNSPPKNMFTKQIETVNQLSTGTTTPHKNLETLNNKSSKDLDSYSIASSTHFTVVNGLDRHRNKISQSNSCCRKHKLTVLILTMSSIFMFGIIVAVYLFEMRAMHLRNSAL